MTQGRLIAFWIAAMLVLGGVYGYKTWQENSGCNCVNCRKAKQSSGESNTLEPSLALNTAMPAIAGTWVTPDGKGPELKDKVVLLDFWGTFCGPCIAAFPGNNKIYEKYAPQGLVMAGVSIDSKAALDDFKKTVEVRYPLLSSNREVFGAYQIEFTPSTFLFNKDGKLIWKGLQLDNPDGSINSSFEKALTQALADLKKPAAAETSATPALGAAYIPVTGTWISPDGKEPVLKGNVVLLDFWGTFCGPCVAAIPSNNKIYEKYAPQGFVLVGVATDTKAVIDDFKKTVDIRYPLLAGNEKAFTDYGIELLPSTFLYDRGGKLVWKGAQLDKRDGTLNPDFEKALTAALAAKAEESSAIVLPPDFQKLLDKEKADRAKEPLDPNAPEPELGLKLGAPMPDLKGDWLTSTGSAPDIKSKVLLIDFFTTVCGSCVESIPANNALYAKYAPEGFVFAFISPEKKATVEEFRANFPKKIEYPVLSNADALFEFCEIKALPATLLFGRDGKLLWKGGLLEKDGKLDVAFEKTLTSALAARKE